MKATYVCLALFLCFFLVLSCDGPENRVFGPGNPDPNPVGGAAPEVVSISPNTAFAEEPITINGQNFSPVPENNLVAFGRKVATVESASETALTVIVPSGLQGTVQVKVASKGSEFFSDDMDFTYSKTLFLDLEASVFAEGFGMTMGITFDADGNCYVNDPDGGVIHKITPAGEESIYAEIGGTGGLAFDGAGNLWGCHKWEPMIFRVDPGGASSAVVYTDEISDPFDIDWDDSGNMYVVGEFDGLFRITPGGEISQLEIDFEHGSAVRVHDNYVYWSDRGGNGEGINRIAKAPITPDGVGETEILFDDPDWTGLTLWGPFGLAIDVEGSVYAVSSFGDGNSFLVRINGNNGRPEIMAELPTNNNKFVEFFGTSIYVTTQFEGVVYKVDIGIEGVPR